MGMDIRSGIPQQPPLTDPTAPTPPAGYDGRIGSVSSSGGVKAPPQQAQAPSPYDTMMKRKALESDIDKIVKQVMPSIGVRFRVHAETGQIITKVINNDTKETIREFPAEKMLDMIHSMCLKLGLAVDRRV